VTSVLDSGDRSATGKQQREQKMAKLKLVQYLQKGQLDSLFQGVLCERDLMFNQWLHGSPDLKSLLSKTKIFGLLFSSNFNTINRFELFESYLINIFIFLFYVLYVSYPVIRFSLSVQLESPVSLDNRSYAVFIYSDNATFRPYYRNQRFDKNFATPRNQCAYGNFFSLKAVNSSEWDFFCARCTDL
jgi:hypothetical protein